ncbi:MAG: hypothetical protein Q4D76_19730, partial [Oscillospiraceae bacterium]|nr:hypothetical protein [Oscillospiraceae bacterium]
HTFLSAFFNNSKIKSNIDAYFKRNPTSGAIDSTGTTGTELKDELIKSLNISDPFDFRIEKDGSDFYIYIFEPLEKVTTGTEIAVTKYKMKNNGEINGTPTEENCKVAEKPNPNTPGNKMKYIVTFGK